MFCLSLHYHENNSYAPVNGAEIFKFKATDSETKPVPFFSGNVSKDLSVDTMKKTELYGYYYCFSGDYVSNDVDDILDIHRYLIKKQEIK